MTSALNNSQKASVIVINAAFSSSLSLMRLSVIAALVAWVGSSSAQALSTDTWGGVTTNDWATSADWTYTSGSGPVASGDSLIFGTTGTQTLANTLTSSSFNINGITFNSTAGTYTMNGNTFNLTAGIANNSANAQKFSETGGLTQSAAATYSGLTKGITITNGLTDTGTAGLTTTVNAPTAFTVLTLGTAGGTGLTLNSGASGAVTDTFNGTSNTVIAGAVVNGSAFANGLTYAGTGTLSLGTSGSITTNATNTYSGQTTINSGTFELYSGVSLPNSSVVANGGQFKIDDNASITSSVTRTSSLTLNGGSLFQSGVAGYTTDAITTLTLGTGQYTGSAAAVPNTIGFTINATGNALTNIGTLVVNPDATVYFSVPGTPASLGSTTIASQTNDTANFAIGQVQFGANTPVATTSALVGGGGTGSSSTTTSILPFITAAGGTTGNSFVTYTTANGVQPLASTNYVNTFAAAIAAGGNFQNVLETTASDSLSANLTVNSFIFGAGGNPSIGSHNLTITSGALMFTVSAGGGWTGQQAH